MRWQRRESKRVTKKHAEARACGRPGGDGRREGEGGIVMPNNTDSHPMSPTAREMTFSSGTCKSAVEPACATALCDGETRTGEDMDQAARASNRTQQGKQDENVTKKGEQVSDRPLRGWAMGGRIPLSFVLASSYENGRKKKDEVV